MGGSELDVGAGAASPTPSPAEVWESAPGESVDDYLQFEGGVLGVDPAARGGMRRFGWSGGWPPPERMGVAVGRESKVVTVFDLDVDGVLRVREHLESVADVMVFRRESFSRIGPQGADSHVARGALYRPEDPS